MTVLSTPYSQVLLLGVVFLLVFTSYNTIEAFAEDNYGEGLGSTTEAAVYGFFFVGCFFSPSITNKFGVRLTMCVGILLGYEVLAAASMVYSFEKGQGQERLWSGLVVFGGAMTGLGASLLWTAQGRLLLQYVEADGGRSGGKLFSLFWSCYNLSSVVGGLLSFGVFSTGGQHSQELLYGVFVCLILLGAGVTLLLRVPSPIMRQHVQLGGGDKGEDISRDSWRTEMSETLVFFQSPYMLSLSLLFLSRGLCVPYQSNTFGNRFFDEKTLGLELALYSGVQVVGSFVLGGVLDRWPAHDRRTIALRVLLAILVVGLLSNSMAMYLEWPYVWSKDVPPINYSQASIVLPTLTFILWGLSDVLTQLFSYWLMGITYIHGNEQARAIGFYKAVTSIGWMIGFLCMPKHRVPPMVQLLATAFCLLVGALLALTFALPRGMGKQGESPYYYTVLLSEQDEESEFTDHEFRKDRTRWRASDEEEQQPPSSSRSSEWF